MSGTSGMPAARFPARSLSRRIASSRCHVQESSMKALVYEGPRKVVVKEMPDAKIERPTDVLVKITTTNICGSDLHMYEGRTNMETGRILGHENLGVVVDVGAGVERIKLATVCVCRSISAVGFARIARKDSPAS